MREVRDETVLWQLHQSDREERGEEEEEQSREIRLTTVAQCQVLVVFILSNFFSLLFSFCLAVCYLLFPSLPSSPLPHSLQSVLTLSSYFRLRSLSFNLVESFPFLRLSYVLLKKYNMWNLFSLYVVQE